MVCNQLWKWYVYRLSSGVYKLSSGIDRLSSGIYNLYNGYVTAYGNGRGLFRKLF